MNSKIIIYVNPNLIMTGILFYCIEHFLYISKYEDVQLCVIFDGDIDVIKGIIKEKYDIINLDNVVKIKPIDLLKSVTKKALVLDTFTYNKIQNFTQKIDKIFLYSNDGDHNAREQDSVYGFYDYQKFNIKERFKIGFQFMKPKTPHLDKTFCSHLALGIGSIDKSTIEEVAKYDVVYKDFNKDLDIFNFKEIIYYHTRHLERNNRIIPEAFYFGNSLVVLNAEDTNDSVNERYTACMEMGASIFQIDAEYKVTKDFIAY